MITDPRFHFWLGYYPDIPAYHSYMDANDSGISPFARDLGVADEASDWETSGVIASLFPDPRYILPLSELFKGSPVRQEDLDEIARRCTAYGIAEPNTYIWYFHPTIRPTLGQTFGGYCYIGRFVANDFFWESRTLLYPETFSTEIACGA